MKNFNIIILWLTFITISGITVTGANEKSATVSPHLVQTVNGPVQGIVEATRNVENRYVAFLGLRYAHPLKRFEPAIPLQETWTAPKLADTPGSPCPQNWDAGEVILDEDCLFLNVYVPEKHLDPDKSAKLPVMVWLHGGGFSFGDGYGYQPTYLLENEDVILVTINYRLALLGFVYTEDDTFVSNNGLRDQIAALKWVQNNIEAFNGLSSEVTIFGSSAGSASVHYLLMSPLARGLFHRAIMQSGAASYWSLSPNPKEVATRIAKHLNCSSISSSTEIRKCLESKSVQELLNTQISFQPKWPPMNPLPRFLPTAKESSKGAFFGSSSIHPLTLSRDKKVRYFSDVPVLAGCVQSEGSTLFTAFVLADPNKELLNDLNKNWNDIAPVTFGYEGHFPAASLPAISQRIGNFYFGTQRVSLETLDNLSDLYSDSHFLLPVMFEAAQMAQHGMTVYPYIVDYEGSWTIRERFGSGLTMPGHVGHGDELQYEFPHPILGNPLNSKDEKFSKRFVKYWVYFAKFGKPAPEFNCEEKLVLNSITQKDKYTFNLMSFQDEPKIKRKDFTEKIQFWMSVSKEAAGYWRDDESHKIEL